MAQFLAELDPDTVCALAGSCLAGLPPPPALPAKLMSALAASKVGFACDRTFSLGNKCSVVWLCSLVGIVRCSWPRRLIPFNPTHFNRALPLTASRCCAARRHPASPSCAPAPWAARSAARWPWAPRSRCCPSSAAQPTTRATTARWVLSGFGTQRVFVFGTLPYDTPVLSCCRSQMAVIEAHSLVSNPTVQAEVGGRLAAGAAHVAPVIVFGRSDSDAFMLAC
jgi:hypothetical protein